MQGFCARNLAHGWEITVIEEPPGDGRGFVAEGKIPKATKP